MEGGIVFGLTAVLKNAIDYEDGRVQQSNFHDYPLLRIDEMPEIEVHIMESGGCHRRAREAHPSKSSGSGRELR
jgi:CO/xanthine dehydrogenase Mo-binding subunit